MKKLGFIAMEMCSYQMVADMMDSFEDCKVVTSLDGEAMHVNQFALYGEMCDEYEELGICEDWDGVPIHDQLKSLWEKRYGKEVAA